MPHENVIPDKGKGLDAVPVACVDAVGGSVDLVIVMHVFALVDDAIKKKRKKSVRFLQLLQWEQWRGLIREHN